MGGIQIVRSIMKFLLKFAFVAILVILGFITFQYSRTCFYNFPETKPFQGDQFYNPYAKINRESRKLKANFHAHGIAWGNYTYGANTDEEVYEAYKKKNYDIIGISNYHSLNEVGNESDSLYFPVYEHGCNILKSHYLVLNPESVSFFDQPLIQSISMQQQVIEKIRESKGAIAIAHPELSGRSEEGMLNLVHYDFIEVLNHYRVSKSFWDHSLSSGKLAWVLGNDDTHDVNDETAFKIWNIIYSESKAKDSVLAKMKKGMHYSVKTVDGVCDKELNLCQIEGGRLHVQFSDTINAIEIIGQNGKIIYTHYLVNEFYYDFNPNDTYVRIEAHDNDFSIYLNPIVRFDGKTIPLNTHLELTVNTLITWLFRFSTWVLLILELYLIYRIIRKRSRS